MPPRIVIHAIQKWGKSSWAAHAPDPIFLTTRGEDRLQALKSNGVIPAGVRQFPRPAMCWHDVNLALNELVVKEHPFPTLVLDSMTGVERFIHEDTCARECDGKWSNFDAFGRGQKVAVATVFDLLGMLDRLREKGMTVIVICHSQVKTFKNPAGPDYDRWEPTLAKETWGALAKWADLILFGQMEATVIGVDKSRPNAKGKAAESATRLLMTEHSPLYDAGNSYNLPAEIECGDSPAEAWANFIAAMKHKSPSE